MAVGSSAHPRFARRSARSPSSAATSRRCRCWPRPPARQAGTGVGCAAHRRRIIWGRGRTAVCAPAVADVRGDGQGGDCGVGGGAAHGTAGVRRQWPVGQLRRRRNRRQGTFRVRRLPLVHRRRCYHRRDGKPAGSGYRPRKPKQPKRPKPVRSAQPPAEPVVEPVAVGRPLQRVRRRRSTCIGGGRVRRSASPPRAGCTPTSGRRPARIVAGRVRLGSRPVQQPFRVPPRGAPARLKWCWRRRHQFVVGVVASTRRSATIPRGWSPSAHGPRLPSRRHRDRGVVTDLPGAAARPPRPAGVGRRARRGHRSAFARSCDPRRDS